MTVSLFIVLRLVAQGKLINLAFFAPVAAVIMLVAVGMSTEQTGFWNDDLRGRLAFSGWLLMDFDIPMLMATNIQLTYYDAGYAHAIATFSLPLCLLLWISLWLLPMPTASSNRFRALVSVYIALILCISGSSFFALKSAGLLWFLVGCCLQNPAAPTGQRASTGGKHDQ
jgi:putative polymerase